jgi:hypothetical protein
MILAIGIGALALAAIIATVRTVWVDGYRRIPTARIARRPEFLER